MLRFNQPLSSPQQALSVFIFSDGENYGKPAEATYTHFIQGTEDTIHKTLECKLGSGVVQKKTDWRRFLVLSQTELRTNPTRYAAMSAGYSSGGYSLLHCTLDCLESADSLLVATVYTVVHTCVPGIAVILSTDTGFVRTKALLSAAGWIVVAVYQQDTLPSVHAYRASGGVGLIQISFRASVLPTINAAQAATVSAVLVIPGTCCAALTRRGIPCENKTRVGTVFCQDHKDATR
ncbi:hypothetical protein BCR33DRAFT_786550 [Rhizoclosmatium globosum]|uniref:Uncharacterized protein n=1 Tax=Rhizoclosmatium globosum TaxID=329046 RepID=A0A1Y2C7R8_9FUNG|nr:hypothetical protein BCR33DRAFT_786550 [Rhizoclosmatium globosum]|eukprot:ORY42355.1 hypothetical protein BCR33DRAFT_786550 [Rhizoclosmatium globosum]